NVFDHSILLSRLQAKELSAKFRGRHTSHEIVRPIPSQRDRQLGKLSQKAARRPCLVRKVQNPLYDCAVCSATFKGDPEVSFPENNVISFDLAFGRLSRSLLGFEYVH